MVAALLALSPMLLSHVPPLYDYPSHLARIEIIHHLLTDGRFAQMYKLNLAVIPNLGIDAFVLPLTLLGVDVEVGGRIFVAVVALALCLGVVAVHRTLFRSPSMVPLAAFAFVYNETFMFGFLNYLLAVALALLGFAQWQRVRDRRLHVVAAFTLAWTVGIFFVHLLGAVLLLGLILSFETTEAVLTHMRPDADRYVRSTASRELLRRTVVITAGLAFLALLYRLTPFADAAPGQSFGDALSAAVGNLPSRLRRLPHVVDGYQPRLDEASAVLLACGVAAAAFLRRLRVNVRMVPAVLGLFAVYLVVPSDWAGTSYIPDRMPLTILLLTLCSFDVIVTGWRMRRVIALCILGVVGLRSATAAVAWRDADRAYAPMLAALDRLPPGSTIYGAVNFAGDHFLDELRLPWEHFCSLASIRRGVFSANVWAIPSQNLILRQSAYEAVGQAAPWLNRVDHGGAPPRPGHDMLAPELIARADYLLAVHPELYQRPLPALLIPLERSGGAVLYRIQHQLEPQVARAGGPTGTRRSADLPP